MKAPAATPGFFDGCLFGANVLDAHGQPVDYVPFGDDEKRAPYHVKTPLTLDQARRIAANLARLPELLAMEKQAKTGFTPYDPTGEESASITRQALSHFEVPMTSVAPRRKARCLRPWSRTPWQGMTFREHS